MGLEVIIPAAMSGLGIASNLFSNNNAAQQQAAIARSSMINAQNQQGYQQQLNAEAIRRATAGTIDAQGNRIYYDPSTNEWKTVLSERGGAVQRSTDNASIERNTTDLFRQQRANAGAESRALSAERTANPLRMAIENFTPMDPRALEGNLQEASSLAHRESYQPVIDSTLRSFARTGQNAAPVLSALASKSNTDLRREMLDNVIKSRMHIGEMNNQNRQGLINSYAAVNREATPNLQYSPLSTSSPTDALTAAISARSRDATGAATAAAYGVPGSTNAFTTAANQGINTVPNSNLLSAQLFSASQQLPRAISAFTDLLNGGSNSGDSTMKYYDTPAPTTAWNANSTTGYF